MFKKFNILIILLLLFISVTAVSAADDVDIELGSDENSDTIEVSDVSEDLDSSEDKEVLSSSYDVTSSSYSTYFDDNGNLKDSVKAGDTISLSGSFNDKHFIFNKTVNVRGVNSNSMKESVLTFLSGASGSTISDLNIANKNSQSYGIFLNGANNCIISGCTITNEGLSSYPIVLANGANYNNVTGNSLRTSGEAYGHGTRSVPTLLVSGSHYNYLANNILDVEDANAIYLSSYNGGPITGGDSNYNIIFNNTVNYHVLPTSWSWAIQVMGSANSIKSNKIIGAYRGITTTGVYNNITDNWIINLTGANYNNKNVETGGEYGIVSSKNSYIANNHIVNAKIISTGAGISAIDNSVIENNYIEVLYKGMGINAGGFNVVVRNNNISTESGVGVYEKDEGSGLTITRNNITSKSAIGILIDKISSRRMPSNVVITYNYINTPNAFAIDASGVEEGTSTIENNRPLGIGIKDASGVFDASKPVYNYDENKTYIINPSNIRDYINDNGNLVNIDEKAIVKFTGEFSNEVIYVNKAVKFIGNNAIFRNSTFKVTSGGVWIENLTIINKGAERLNAWGIYVDGADGVKIVKNRINVTDPNAAYAIYVLESSYVEVINNTLFSEGDFLTFTLLVYSSDECVFKNNIINTLGTGEVYKYSTSSSIEGQIYYVNGTEVFVDGNTVCIDGVTYCIDGQEVCIDGNYLKFYNNTYLIQENHVNINGTDYPIENNTVCIDGVCYCLDGNEICIDGVTYCLDGSDLIVGGVRYTLDGNNSVCIDGVVYCLDGNEVCIDGNYLKFYNETYLIQNNSVTINGNVINIVDNSVCIDGVVYCLDGNEVCIDGKVYCLDGNELVSKGTSYETKSHVVPELYRTYGILLLYSSSNDVSQNTVNVTSKLDKIYPNMGNNSSQNSIVGIDIYYNSHDNVISNNTVYVSGKDNFIYGVGVKGDKDGHTASEGQGASNNKFIGNIITLEGNYYITGFIVGSESEGTVMEKNIVNINSDTVSYGITLESSHKSSIIGNDLTLNSDVAYGVEIYSSNNNVIDSNYINGNGKYVYGIISSGSNNNITNNKILANGTGDDAVFYNKDTLGYGNAGICLTGNSTNNIIKSNNITSQTGFAIIAQSSGNTIENNYLESEQGNSTKGINGTEGNTLKDNYIYRVTGIIEDATIPYLGSGFITLKLNNKENILLEGGLVSFYDDLGNNIGNVTVNENNEAILYYTIDESYFPSAFYCIKAIFKKEDFETTAFETNNLYVDKGNLNIAVSDVSVKDGIKGKFTATITNALGKPVSGLTVRFFNFDTGNRQAWGTAKTDVNGVATIIYFVDKYFAEDFGKQTNVTAVVSESNDYAESNNTGLLTILDIAPVTVKINSKVGFNGVLATLTDNNALPVSNKIVSITIDGKAQNVKTNANGEVILPSTGAGLHNIVISSAKDSLYDGSSSASKVTVVAAISDNKNANVYFGNTVQYKIRLADKNGNYLKANSPVTIKVNGKAVNLKTDANGYVVYSVKKVGTYTVTAEHNGQKVSNKIVIKPTLTAKNISKKKAKKIKFTVKVVDKKGKAVKKKKVTFKVKGKKYTAKTNKKGVATVTLKNLKVGKYTISSSYGGCTIKNTIKIKK